MNESISTKLIRNCRAGAPPAGERRGSFSAVIDRSYIGEPRACLKARGVLAAVLVSLTLTSLEAAETPTITISKTDVIAISVQPVSGADGAVITKTLQADLAASGYFNVTGSGAAGLTAGGVSSGSTLEGKVSEHGGKVAIAGTYNGDARGKAHEFANDIVRTLTGNPGMAGTKIAFVATRSGRKEIYTADYSGGNVQQLTHDNAIAVGPSLSPDGRHLAYTGYQSGYADIYLIDLANGSRQHLIKFPGTNTGAAFSPDGSRIACTLSKDGNPELYICSLGGSAHRLTRSPGVESAPSWSPNGDEIVYAYDHGGPQLYRISSGGGSGRPIPTGFGYCTEPDWSPDGHKIAFNIRQGGGFAIAVVDLGSGQTHTLGEGESPVWGPDSRHLIYASGSVLYLADMQTGRKSKVVDGLGKVSEPTWSR